MLNNKKIEETQELKPQEAEFDAGSKYLSEALRLWFVLLKVLIIILLVVFVISCFKVIGSDEQALVLRFGKIRDIGENGVLGPGYHLVFPRPIDELVRIPVEKKTSLAIGNFWYYQTASDLLPEGPKNPSYFGPTLDPIKDGYCITRSELGKKAEVISGSDYNIVHCKWQLIYKIDNPIRFLRNVYVRDIKPGEIYYDVIRESLKPFLVSMVEDAVVSTMVKYTIDEALSGYGDISNSVAAYLQRKLDAMESGISVESVQLTEKAWPRQVDEAFQQSIIARQTREKLINEANNYSRTSLYETGGIAGEALLKTLKDGSLEGPEQEQLWSQLAGTGQEIISSAIAYRTKVVENAKANSEYLERLLPEYRKYPQLVLQRIYQDAIVEVLEKVDEKIIIQPGQGSKSSEIRLLLNRDPSIKSGKKEEK